MIALSREYASVFGRPVIRAVEFVTDRANFLQYLTIRRYLSLVFMALIVLLCAVTLAK